MQRSPPRPKVCHWDREQSDFHQSGGCRDCLALSNGTNLILADEPTGSLDSQSGHEVLDLLTRLNEHEGATLVLVTHDATIAERGKRLIRMLDGEVLEDART